jgi:hypothetical protein
MDGLTISYKHMRERSPESWNGAERHEFILNNVFKLLASNLTENTNRLHYKDQQVNAVYRNKRCLYIHNRA